MAKQHDQQFKEEAVKYYHTLQIGRSGYTLLPSGDVQFFLYSKKYNTE